MFFDRPDSGERAVLVHLKLGSDSQREDPREFEELVLSAGGDPVAFIMGARDVPHARTFVGSGKLAEIKEEVHEQCAEVVMFNHALSPSQERNLEAGTGVPGVGSHGFDSGYFCSASPNS